MIVSAADDEKLKIDRSRLRRDLSITGRLNRSLFML